MIFERFFKKWTFLIHCRDSDCHCDTVYIFTEIVLGANENYTVIANNVSFKKMVVLTA